jgi:hypothetical protein
MLTIGIKVGITTGNLNAQVKGVILKKLKKKKKKKKKGSLDLLLW